MLELLILALLIAAASVGLSERRRRRVVTGESSVEPDRRLEATAVSDSPGAPSAAVHVYGAPDLLRKVTLPFPQLRVPQLRGVPRPGALVLALALALVWLGQYQLTGPEFRPTALALYLLGILVVVALEREARARARPVSAARDDPPSAISENAVTDGARSPRLQRWLLGGAVAGALLVADQTRFAPPDQSYAVSALVWLLALGCAIVAAFPASTSIPRLRLNALRERFVRPGPESVAVGCILLTALLLRVVAVDITPYAFGGDEGSQAMSAVSVLEGTLTNPFGTGWYSVPTLFYFLQAASIAIFGDSVGGIRVVSAVIGTLSVLFTYLLARRWFGRGPALMAAALLTVFHFHVHFSRLASVQIADSFFIVAVLFFLDRGVREGRRLDWLLAGIAVGLSQYFYLGGRVIPLVAVAFLAIMLVRQRWAHQMTPREGGLSTSSRLVPWMAMGGVLTYLPLLGHYLRHPGEFGGRMNQVSLFTTDWLAKEQILTGMSAPALILQQIERAMFLPFHTRPGGWYLGDPPFIGLPMAVTIAIGLGIVAARVLRPAYFGLAVAYLVVVLGLGLTVNPVETQRLVIVAPIMAMLAAIALDAVVRIIRHVARAPAIIAQSLGAALIVGLGVWNLLYYFSAPIEFRLYGDSNTVVATELGHHLRSLGRGYTVYFHGPPRMWYYGFQSVPFIARGAKGIDVERPAATESVLPSLQGPTVFVFLPERLGELPRVRERFPGGEVREFHAYNGMPLFTAYQLRRD